MTMTEPRNSDPASLVEYIARSLVRNPDDVQVLPVKSPASLILELRVNKDDIGMIIGKGGRMVCAVGSNSSTVYAANTPMPRAGWS